MRRGNNESGGRKDEWKGEGREARNKGEGGKGQVVREENEIHI